LETCPTERDGDVASPFLAIPSIAIDQVFGPTRIVFAGWQEPAQATPVSGGVSSVRFVDVVKTCGRPRPYLPWADPRKDRAFQADLKRQRIMTIHQTLRGGKKDFGAVGYEPDRAAQFLVFPKSLHSFAGKRVIAIRYDLLLEEEKSGSSAVPPAREGRAGKAPDRRLAPPPRGRAAEVIPFAPPAEKPAALERSRRVPARARPRLNAAAREEIEAALAELAKHRSDAAEARLKRLLGSKPKPATTA
jgi:hypothetical protein